MKASTILKRLDNLKKSNREQISKIDRYLGLLDAAISLAPDKPKCYKCGEIALYSYQHLYGTEYSCWKHSDEYQYNLHGSEGSVEDYL